MSKPRLLDLFCCAGGAAVGYARAGFEVVGVDNRPQPRYPFTFVQADALSFPLNGFDAVHASPPCHLYSCTRSLSTREKPDLVPVIREKLLKWNDGPWVIENVPGAPMWSGVVLCGTMFALRVFRHRYFESNHLLFAPMGCRHDGKVKRYGQKNGRGRKTGEYITVAGHDFQLAAAREAMGIDWMNRDEMAQAIPPAYTEWIGRQLMEVIV